MTRIVHVARLVMSLVVSVQPVGGVLLTIHVCLVVVHVVLVVALSHVWVRIVRLPIRYHASRMLCALHDTLRSSTTVSMSMSRRLNLYILTRSAT